MRITTASEDVPKYSVAEPGEEASPEEEEEAADDEALAEATASQATIASAQTTAAAEAEAAPDDDDGPPKVAETRVGKKLSEMTTRRTIVLVLVMLFGLPQFMPASHGYDELKHSPNLAIEFVYDKWRRFCPSNATHPGQLPSCFRSDALAAVAAGGEVFKDVQGRAAEARYWYERYLLSFIHMHHDGAFAYKLHWVGLQSKPLSKVLQNEGVKDSENQAHARLAHLGQLSQKTFLDNNSLPTSSWDATFASENWVTEIVTLSAPVKARLTSPWKEACQGFTGVATGADTVETPSSDNVPVCTLDNDLRCAEMEFFVALSRTDSDEHPEHESDVQLLFVFDKRGVMRTESVLSMFQTVFICIAVGVGAMTFANDANLLLLKPIERMMMKVETIKDNPMQAMRLGDEEFKTKQNEKEDVKTKVEEASALKKCWMTFAPVKVQEPMETVILEKTIIKLGGLLALCFGLEGGEIIGKYIGDTQSSNDTSACVDIVVPGHKVEAIIVFCHIRRFDQVTSALEEKSLMFVNLISEIVHLVTDDYSGAANKNMGDSFLLAWRYTDGQSKTKLNDMALMASVGIVSSINKSPELARYRNHMALGGDFTVDVGLGVHTGWAIEGAIGSDYKIDASYVSPHAKIADKLQGATVHYGVHILMSDVIVAHLSPGMALNCRMIDQVESKTLRRPMRVYTIDLDESALHADTKPVIPKAKNRFRWRQVRDMQKAAKWGNLYHVCEEFTSDPEIREMRKGFSTEFFKRFFTAYRNYEAGEWMVARDLFFTCHFEPKYHTPPVNLAKADWPQDGPTRALLSFMESHDFEAPPEWPGYRQLHQ